MKMMGDSIGVMGPGGISWQTDDFGDTREKEALEGCGQILEKKALCYHGKEELQRQSQWGIVTMLIDWVLTLKDVTQFSTCASGYC